MFGVVYSGYPKAFDGNILSGSVVRNVVVIAPVIHDSVHGPEHYVVFARWSDFRDRQRHSSARVPTVVSRFASLGDDRERLSVCGHRNRAKILLFGFVASSILLYEEALSIEANAGLVVVQGTRRGRHGDSAWDQR